MNSREEIQYLMDTGVMGEDYDDYFLELYPVFVEEFREDWLDWFPKQNHTLAKEWYDAHVEYSR